MRSATAAARSCWRTRECPSTIAGVVRDGIMMSCLFVFEFAEDASKERKARLCQPLRSM